VLDLPTVENKEREEKEKEKEAGLPFDLVTSSRLLGGR